MKTILTMSDEIPSYSDDFLGFKEQNILRDSSSAISLTSKSGLLNFIKCLCPCDFEFYRLS